MSQIPEGKRVIHATLDPADINKDVPVDAALVGDAQLDFRGIGSGYSRDRSGNGASDSQTAAVAEEISNSES